jgi:hypothetical protein
MLGTLALFFAPIGRKKKVQAPVLIEPEPYLFGPIDKFWYYVDGSNSRVGPLSHDSISDEWKTGKITNKTYIWHEDLTEWKPLEELIRR